MCHALSVGSPTCLLSWTGLQEIFKLAQAWPCDYFFACASLEGCLSGWVAASRRAACVRRARDVASSNGCSRFHNVLLLWGGNSNVTSCGMATCRPLRHNPCPNSAFDIAWLNYIRTTMHDCHDCRRVARVAKRSRALKEHQYHYSH